MRVMDAGTGPSSVAGALGLDCRRYHGRIQGGLSSRLFLRAFFAAFRATRGTVRCSSTGTIGKAVTLMTSMFLK